MRPAQPAKRSHSTVHVMEKERSETYPYIAFHPVFVDDATLN